MDGCEMTGVQWHEGQSHRSISMPFCTMPTFGTPLPNIAKAVADLPTAYKWFEAYTRDCPFAFSDYFPMPWHSFPYTIQPSTHTPTLLFLLSTITKRTVAWCHCATVPVSLETVCIARRQLLHSRTAQSLIVK